MADENNVETNDGTSENGVESGTNDSVQFTPEQQVHIDSLIAERLNRAQKANEADYAAKLAKEKAQWQLDAEEASKIAKMNEEQRKDYEAQKSNDDLIAAQQRADELQNQLNQLNMTNEATKILADKNIVADEKILGFVVRETADDTVAAVNDFVALVNDKAELMRQAGLVGKTPKSGQSGSGIGGKSLGQTLAEEANARSKSNAGDSFFGKKN